MPRTLPGWLVRAAPPLLPTVGMPGAPPVPLRGEPVPPMRCRLASLHAPLHALLSAIARRPPKPQCRPTELPVAHAVPNARRAAHLASGSHCRPARLQALASAFGFTFSATVALACTTALLSLAGVWAAVGLSIAAGEGRDYEAAGRSLPPPSLPPTQLLSAVECLTTRCSCSANCLFLACTAGAVPALLPAYWPKLPCFRASGLPGSMCPASAARLPTAGTFLACVLAVLGFSLLVAAVVSGAMAAGALSGERCFAKALPLHAGAAFLLCFLFCGSTSRERRILDAYPSACLPARLLQPCSHPVPCCSPRRSSVFVAFPSARSSALLALRASEHPAGLAGLLTSSPPLVVSHLQHMPLPAWPWAACAW